LEQHLTAFCLRRCGRLTAVVHGVLASSPSRFPSTMSDDGSDFSDLDELADDDADFTPTAAAAASVSVAAAKPKGKGKKAEPVEFRIRGALNPFRPANLPVGALVRVCPFLRGGRARG
jgi:hypothetical protein